MTEREDGTIVSDRPLRLNEDDPPVSLLEFFYALNSFRAVAAPVLLTMVLSAFAVLYIVDPETGEAYGGVESPYLVVNETAAGSSGEAFGLGALNALVIVGAIAAITFVLVLCVYYNCWTFLTAYMFLAIALILGVSTSVTILLGLQYYFIWVDGITFTVFFVNYALTGVLVLFSAEANFWGNDYYNPFPAYFGQLYLVFLSVVTAYLVTTIFPFFTTWLLLVVLALYDLCAVLTPCGPLKLLLKVADDKAEKGQDLALPSALLYSADVRNHVPNSNYASRPPPTATKRGQGGGAAGAAGFFAMMVSQDEEPREQKRQEAVEEEGEYEWVQERDNIKLGLGDFIFYSVLTASSAEFGFTACLSVICCIMTGLVGTLILLSVFQKALPALPISIALGVGSYLLASFFISPMADGLGARLISV